MIIDDDGLGYVEDGCRTRTRGTEASRRTAVLQQLHAVCSGEISASDAIQQISSMFTSSVFQRPGSDRAKSLALAADSIVDDVIAEFAPDEDDREERRRRVGRVIVDAEMARSNNGNDMAVELKNDAEMETNLEEISGTSGS